MIILHEEGARLLQVELKAAEALAQLGTAGS